MANNAAQKKCSRNHADGQDSTTQVYRLLEQATSVRISAPQQAVALCQQAQQEAQSSANTSLFAHCRCELGISYRVLADYPNALIALHEAHRLTTTDDMALQATAAHNLGIVYTAMHDSTKAAMYLQESLQLRTALGDTKGRAASLTSLGNRHVELGNAKEALLLFQQALSLCHDINDNAGIAKIQFALGNAHFHLQEWTQAIAYYQQALEFRRSLGDTYGVARLLANLGAALLQNNDLEAALHCQVEALVLADELQDHFSRQRSFAYIGVIENKRGNHTLALQHLQQALAITQTQTHDSIGTTDILYKIALVLCALHRYNEAAEHCNQSLALAQEFHILPAQCQAHKLLAEAQEALGDTATALGHYRQYMQQLEALHLQEKRDTVAMLQREYDVERSRREAELHKLKHRELEAAMEFKMKELASATEHLIERNSVIESLRKELTAILADADSNTKPRLRALIADMNKNRTNSNKQQDFHHRVQQAHRDFISALSLRYPELSPTELTVCAYIRMNLHSKEIASLLNVSLRNVEMHRYRLRRKLNLSSGTNLTVFLMNL